MLYSSVNSLHIQYPEWELAHTPAAHPFISPPSLLPVSPDAPCYLIYAWVCISTLFPHCFIQTGLSCKWQQLEIKFTHNELGSVFQLSCAAYTILRNDCLIRFVNIWSTRYLTLIILNSLYLLTELTPLMVLSVSTWVIIDKAHIKLRSNIWS